MESARFVALKRLSPHVIEKRGEFDSRLTKDVPQGARSYHTMVRDGNVPVPTYELDVRSGWSYSFEAQPL